MNKPKIHRLFIGNTIASVEKHNERVIDDQCWAAHRKLKEIELRGSTSSRREHDHETDIKDSRLEWARRKASFARKQQFDSSSLESESRSSSSESPAKLHSSTTVKDSPCKNRKKSRKRPRQRSRSRSVARASRKSRRIRRRRSRSGSQTSRGNRVMRTSRSRSISIERDVSVNNDDGFAEENKSRNRSSCLARNQTRHKNYRHRSTSIKSRSTKRSKKKRKKRRKKSHR